MMVSEVVLLQSILYEGYRSTSMACPCEIKQESIRTKTTIRNLQHYVFFNIFYNNNNLSHSEASAS